MMKPLIAFWPRAMLGRPCLSLFLGLLSFSTLVSAGTIRADRSDTAYRDLAAGFSNVGLFHWTQGGSSMLASGTLVNHQWVLTAAHVSAGIDANPGSMTFTVAGQTYTASDVLTHIGWTGNVDNGFDIGLIKLDRPVPTITPATLFAGSNEAHDLTTVVGFGSSGTGLTGVVSAAGTKRAGTNVIGLGSTLNGIPWTGGGDDTTLVADFDAPEAGLTGDPRVNLAVPTDLEYCAAGGDSGGAWFLNQDGRSYLAGVTSFLLPNPANSQAAMYGDIFGASRVSTYRDWIWDRAVVSGDLSLDGSVNALDISPFVQRLTGGSYQLESDLNRDQLVNALDISGFVQSLTTSAATAVPEPAVALALSVLCPLLARRSRRTGR